MTPLKLDKYIRCVKYDDREEWFAYSSDASVWFPITVDKAIWILSMMPDFNAEKTIDSCRENCYNSYNPTTKKFDKSNSRI